VAARQPDANAHLSAFLSRLPPETIALARRCLPKLRRAFPGTCELVYDYTRSVVVAFGNSERGHEAIAAISFAPRVVRLYLDKSLPDPKRLLEGTGGKVRFVTIESASELDRGDIHALIKAAKKHSGATFPRGRSTRMVIKSKPKK
jgi:hypothetical protein